MLATGGYANNQALFARLTGGRRIVTGAYIYNTGEGIQSALDLGARRSRVATIFLPKFGGVRGPAGQRAALQHRLPLDDSAGSATPGEIFVNTLGERFVREDHPEHRCA